MKKHFFQVALIVIFLLTLLNGAGLCADVSDNLKPLLVDLKAWSAEKPEGSSMNMGGMKMINAVRNYTNGNMSFDATILIGSSAMLPGQAQTMNVETSEVKISTSNIDGFKIMQTFDKVEKIGQISINLQTKPAQGSLFMVNYSGISSSQALELAKTFNWNKIKTVTSKLMD